MKTSVESSPKAFLKARKSQPNLNSRREKKTTSATLAKGDIHLLLVGHPFKLYVADLVAATRRSFGPSLRKNIVLIVQNRNKRLKNLYYKVLDKYKIEYIHLTLAEWPWSTSSAAESESAETRSPSW